VFEEGPIRKRLREKRLLKRSFSPEITPEALAADISQLGLIIKEAVDLQRRYNDWSNWGLRTTEARELLAQLSFTEMNNVTKLKELKAKLERELER